MLSAMSLVNKKICKEIVFIACEKRFPCKDTVDDFTSLLSNLRMRLKLFRILCLFQRAFDLWHFSNPYNTPNWRIHSWCFDFYVCTLLNLSVWMLFTACSNISMYSFHFSHLLRFSPSTPLLSLSQPLSCWWPAVWVEHTMKGSCCCWWWECLLFCTDHPTFLCSGGLIELWGRLQRTPWFSFSFISLLN